LAKKTGDEFRTEIAWRTSFETDGRWGIPMMRRQPLVEGEMGLLSFSDTRPHDRQENTCKGVHFFIDDPRFEGIYTNPERSFGKLSQYRFLLTPDFSLYADMEPWMQLASVAKGRWCGAYWQRRGLVAYPTMSWGTPQTYEFCFRGFERGGTVAVATYACRSAKGLFLQGYREMRRQLDPEHVICLGEPFDEMEGVDIVIDHIKARKAVR